MLRTPKSRKALRKLREMADPWGERSDYREAYLDWGRWPWRGRP